jgi:hypothetical protein
MVLVTKENGEEIKLMGKASSGMLMEMFLMVNGRMIKLTAMVFILTLMELSMKDIGKMTFNMDME